jgi:cholera toxin transcriptional activator
MAVGLVWAWIQDSKLKVKSSAQAPVDVVPVAKQREHQQQKRNQQQSGSFRRIDCVPAMLVIVLRIGSGHAHIVRSLLSGSGASALECESLVGARRSNLPALANTKPKTQDPTPNPFLLNYGVVPQNRSRIARFGVFELDLSAGELRKSGVKLRLQGQPFQVLAVLLERAGEVVTREELQQKLWPSDTFVDFDHSLNTAVNKVREALGDSASSPRYVETLARRGYRFIAEVHGEVHPDFRGEVPAAAHEEIHADLPANAPVKVPPPGSSVVAHHETSAATAPAPPNPPVSLHPELEVPIPRRALTRGLFALTQIMYLCFYLSALFLLRYVQEIGDSIRHPWGEVLVAAVLITAGVGIPLRLYLLSAVGFDYQRLGEKFRQIFPFVLALDQLWAVAPFLLIDQIGLGAAFAVSAALLYLPFSERTLIRMAYVGRGH